MYFKYDTVHEKNKFIISYSLANTKYILKYFVFPKLSETTIIHINI